MVIYFAEEPPKEVKTPQVSYQYYRTVRYDPYTGNYYEIA